MSFSTILPIEDDEECRQLAKSIPNQSGASDVCEQIRECALSLHSCLETQGQSIQQGPIDPGIRISTSRAIRKLSKTSKGLADAIEALGGQSRLHIERIVKSRGLKLGKHRSRDLSELVHALHQLETWANDARSFYCGRDNTPPTLCASDAVFDLARVWEEQTGKLPARRIGTENTRDAEEGQPYGPFYDLCKVIIFQVYDAHGKDRPNIDYLIRSYREEISSSYGDDLSQ